MKKERKSGNREGSEHETLRRLMLDDNYEVFRPHETGSLNVRLRAPSGGASSASGGVGGKGSGRSAEGGSSAARGESSSVGAR